MRARRDGAARPDRAARRRLRRLRWRPEEHEAIARVEELLACVLCLGAATAAISVVATPLGALLLTVAALLSTGAGALLLVRRQTGYEAAGLAVVPLLAAAFLNVPVAGPGMMTAASRMLVGSVLPVVLLAIAGSLSTGARRRRRIAWGLRFALVLKSASLMSVRRWAFERGHSQGGWLPPVVRGHPGATGQAVLVQASAAQPGAGSGGSLDSPR